MASRAHERLDERLLHHHPAGQACLEACTANGWAPGSSDVLRLVRLWSEVREGHRSENDLSPARLEFARWLKEHGRIGEELDVLDHAA
ncbi:MAG: hypothetical protein ACR2NO_00625 [Chloroflexota bacterium]